MFESWEQSDAWNLDLDSDDPDNPEVRATTQQQQLLEKESIARYEEKSNYFVSKKQVNQSEKKGLNQKSVFDLDDWQNEEFDAEVDNMFANMDDHTSPKQIDAFNSRKQERSHGKSNQNPESPLRKRSKPAPLSKKNPVRKFPGPAGILPRISDTASFKMKLNCVADENQDDLSDTAVQKNQMRNLPAVSEEFQETEEWRKAIQDLGMDENDPKAPINKCNIAWIKRKEDPGVMKRIPVLICMLVDFNRDTLDPRCILQDRSGRIEATIRREVADEYSSSLVKGTVFVLQEIRPLLLNIKVPTFVITKSNLVSILRPRYQGKPERLDVVYLTKEDMKKITKLMEQYEKTLVYKLRATTSSPASSTSTDSVPPFRPPQSSTPVHESAMSPGTMISTAHSLFSGAYRPQSNSRASNPQQLSLENAPAAAGAPKQFQQQHQPMSSSSSSAILKQIVSSANASQRKINQARAAEVAKNNNKKFVFKSSSSNVASKKPVFEDDILEGLDEESIFGDF